MALLSPWLFSCEEMDGKGQQLIDIQVLQTRNLPFHKLPNLPKPVVSTIDLGITRGDSFAGGIKKRVGYYSIDQVTQTTASDIVDLKSVTDNIGILVKDIGQLRKDLNSAEFITRQDYKKLLEKRAAELYYYANERINELENLHVEKIEIIRSSYRSQLSNAISKIAGEYENYYNDVLAGKTGRHDEILQKLKQKNEILELKLEESNEALQQLQQELEIIKKQQEKTSSSIESPGISLEKAEELSKTISRLEDNLSNAETEMAEKEDHIIKLNHQNNSLNRKLDLAKDKIQHLQEEMESFRKKSLSESEKAAQLANSQLEALKKQMEKKMFDVEKEAIRKVSEVADLQRMRDQAQFQKKLNERKMLEDKLRADAHQRPSEDTISDSDLMNEVGRLKKLSLKQKNELERLTKELDRSNRVWETKLAIMQKNFHALRDESYVRYNFQKQSALLHHATIGYAANPAPPSHSKLRPLPKIRLSTRSTRTSSLPQSSEGRKTAQNSSPEFLPPTPTPTPLPSERINEDESLSGDDRPKSVHFDDKKATSPKPSESLL